jgi:hypothetical protein
MRTNTQEAHGSETSKVSRVKARRCHARARRFMVNGSLAMRDAQAGVNWFGRSVA